MVASASPCPKLFYQEKCFSGTFIFFLASKKSWEQGLIIDPATRADLEWWKNAVQSWNGNPIVLEPVDVTMETDASHTGWGAICQGQEAAIFWTRKIALMPSNYREMMAILMVLKPSLMWKTKLFEFI